MHAFHRYLMAKRTVDDRALNRWVLQQFQRHLEGLPRPLDVLEVGAGLGTMLMRLVEWGLLSRATYTLLDADAGLLNRAPEVLEAWARARGWSWTREGEGFRLLGPRLDLQVRLLHADVYDAFAGPAAYHVLIAHAVLDLLHLPVVLPHLLQRLRPGGVGYFTLNFDGVTVFQPSLEDIDEEGLLAHYHRSMDRRTHRGLPGGTATTGRRLFHALQRAGARVVAAGASDWVVFPEPGGTYPHDEAFFLAYILETIHTALAAMPEVPPREREAWYRRRREHLEQGQLVYIAHQLDVLALWPGAHEGVPS